MTGIRVVPRRPPWLDAALVAVETTTGLVLAHRAAGGMLPSVPWVVAMAVTVYGLGLLVLRGTLRPAVAAPGLVAAQLLLHCWLSSLPQPGYAAGPHAGHGGHAGMAAGAHLGLTVPMVLAHLAAGLLSCVLWVARRRAVRLVATWGGAQPHLPARAPGRAYLPSGVLRPTLLLQHTAPRRGPPGLLAA